MTKLKAGCVNVVVRDHKVKGGVCTQCERSSAELKTPCPGYATAGELVKQWPKRPKKGGKK